MGKRKNRSDNSSAKISHNNDFERRTTKLSGKYEREKGDFTSL